MTGYDERVPDYQKISWGIYIVKMKVDVEVEDEF